MNRQEIYAAIPHRPPFLFIDEVVARDERHAHCRKTFRDDEYFYAGHYPGHPVTPGVELCEAAMQAGAILLAGIVAAESGAVPVATRMNDVRFKRIVRPGETVDIEVTLNERLANAFYLTARVTVAGQMAVRFDFAVTQAAVPDAAQG